jgi:UDP-GlcNAc3NAcA epimerase
LNNIIAALNEIAKEKQVILPLHPRTKGILKKSDCNISNLTIINPVGYLNMIWLIEHCSLIMTDSGGLQKEAFFFKKPCITMRNETEWVELVDNGFNAISGTDKDKISNVYAKYDFQTNYDIDLYGSGIASKTIIKKISSYNYDRVSV